MSPRLRSTLLLAAVGTGALAIPSLVLGAMGAAQVGALAGLGALGAVLTAIALGLRAALITSVVLGVLCSLGVAASPNVVAATVFMTLVAAAFGWTARIGANRAIVLVPITLAFVVNEPPQASGSTIHPTLLLGVATIAAACLASVATAGALGRTTPAGHVDVVSRSRADAFAALLAITTVVTTAIAVGGDWGHAGGWMVMTPFIVIQPYVQEGWRKALRRAGGTIGGFLIAMALATTLHDTAWLLFAGVVFAGLTITAYARHLDYGIYSLLLTPAVVILEGIGGDVQVTAVDRLDATLIGAGLSLLAMAIALPFYRREARADQVTRY